MRSPQASMTAQSRSSATTIGDTVDTTGAAIVARSPPPSADPDVPSHRVARSPTTPFAVTVARILHRLVVLGRHARAPRWPSPPRTSPRRAASPITAASLSDTDTATVSSASVAPVRVSVTRCRRRLRSQASSTPQSKPREASRSPRSSPSASANAAAVLPRRCPSSASHLGNCRHNVAQPSPSRPTRHRGRQRQPSHALRNSETEATVRHRPCHRHCKRRSRRN